MCLQNFTKSQNSGMRKEYRMYCLAERHLSSIQKAIQSAHAIVEYGLKYGACDDYIQWGNNDKTLIVLDGGNVPDLHETIRKLREVNYPHASFNEPDMGGMITAVAFLADNTIYDYDTYGTNYNSYAELSYPVETNYSVWLKQIGGKKGEVVKEIISGLRIAI